MPPNAGPRRGVATRGQPSDLRRMAGPMMTRVRLKARLQLAGRQLGSCDRGLGPAMSDADGLDTRSASSPVRPGSGPERPPDCITWRPLMPPPSATQPHDAGLPVRRFGLTPAPPSIPQSPKSRIPIGRHQHGRRPGQRAHQPQLCVPRSFPVGPAPGSGRGPCLPCITAMCLFSTIQHLTG